MFLGFKGVSIVVLSDYSLTVSPTSDLMNILYSKPITLRRSKYSGTMPKL